MTGRLLPPVTGSMLEHPVTMDAAQGVDFLRRIRPSETVPI